MKKLLTLVALLGAAAFSYGQGYVIFANSSGATTIKTNGVTVGGPVGSWYYALLWAPVGTPLNNSLSGWTFGAYGTNTATAGRMAGISSSDGQAAAVAGTAPTSTEAFAVVGWSANVGGGSAGVMPASWSEVLGWWNGGATLAGTGTGGNGWFGISPVALGASGTGILLAPNGGPYNGVFGSAASQLIPGFAMGYYLVPEPSTFALAGLGAAALLIFRRRK